MSAYKKLNRQDVFVSDYVARKQWSISGSALSNYSVERLRGFATGSFNYRYPNDLYLGRHEELVYKSIDHLFYEGSFGTGVHSGSRDLSLQTSLTLDGTRNINNEVGVFSLPRDIYGTHVEPSTFVLQPSLDDDIDNYIEDGYCIDSLSGRNEYFQTIRSFLGGVKEPDITDYLISESNYISESATGTTPGQYVDIDKNQQRVEIIDDGNGALIYSGSELSYTKPREVLGDIIYNQGLAIFTNEEIARMYSTYIRPRLSWKSNQPIYTYNINCKVKDSEFNFTFNPSALTGSYGELNSNITGSSFSPYVTTVGLYNDSNELVAVAKTNKPIPKSKNSDMTFVVKIDI